MFRKTVSATIVSLLMLGTLVLALNIQPVRASGTIYIRADGSIDPSTSPILTVENVTYTLTGNFNESLVVERDNIVVDGAGHRIKGTTYGGTRGIDLSYRSNVTVENLELEGFRYCIYLFSASGNRIIGNNITGDMVGYAYGIVLGNSSYNSVVENNIKDCSEDSVYSALSSYNILTENNITSNGVGFEFYKSSYNNLSRNAITNNGVGIDFYLSANNTISENNITNNYDGIWLTGTSTGNNLFANNIQSNSEFGILLSSPNNVFKKNSMSNNGENLLVFGSIQDFWNDIDTSNTVDGKPVYYWTNESDRTVPLEAGYVALINCSDITVQGLNLFGKGITLQLVSTANSTIKENNITDSSDSGIALLSSSNNTILYNNITTFGSGIELSSSFGNSIHENNIESNNGNCIILESSNDNNIFENDLMNSTAGIDLRASSHNSVFRNNLANNSIGIWLEGGVIGSSNNNLIFANNLTENDDGISIASSEGNVISGNSITANRRVGLFFIYSSNNIIFQNEISNNNCGVYFLEYYGDGTNPPYFILASNNTFYYNNFTNNTEQVNDYGWQNPQFPTSINKWDLGYPSGGNYWSDYNGSDLYNGPYQNVLGNDGIGDTPHVIGAKNIDHYPLMNPNNYPPTCSLTITWTTGGTTNPTFGTYFFSTGSSINVTATPSQNCIFDHWDLDGVNIGSANPYTATMNMSHSLTANFWLIGDVNNDGKVDIVDVSIAARAFGSAVGTARWNPAADVDRNGKIDIRDIALTARNFGQQYP